MSIWSLTYQQSVFQRYHNDKHFSEYLPTSKKGGPYSITERKVPELIAVLGSQPVGDVSHKPGGGLPLLSARPAVTPATLKRADTNFAAWKTEAQLVKHCLPKRLRQRRDCDLSPGPSAPESSTLTTRLPSHPRPTRWRQISTGIDLEQHYVTVTGYVYNECDLCRTPM